MAWSPQNFVDKVGPTVKAAWLNLVDNLLGVTATLTPAEITAGITTVTPGYPPGHLFRYLSAAQLADVLNHTASLDLAPAFQQALSIGGAIFVPGYTYRLASGIHIPGGSSLDGEWMSAFNGPAGTILVFDLSVATCITVGGTPTAGVGLSNVAVNRAAGSVPAGSKGILVNNAYNPYIFNVFSLRHAVPFYFGPVGIAANISNIYTGAATDAHLVQDTCPELRIEQGRFGLNGGGDFNCNTYLRVTGGDTVNPAGGPNTLFCTDCQFNQGSNTVTHWLEFVNQNPGTVGDVEQWQFENCHIETITGPYLFTDSTWPGLTRFRLANCQFNSVAEFIGVNAATTIDTWEFTSCQFSGTFTLNAAYPHINFLQLSNNRFLGLLTIHGVAGATVTLSNNIENAGTTTTGVFATFSMLGDQLGGAGWTNSATFGAVNVFTQQAIQGKLIVNAPTTDGGIVINLPSGGAGLQVADSVTGAGTTGHLTVTAPNNTNGASIELTGNGGVTPAKFLRVVSGVLQVLNNAYTTVLMNLADDGTVQFPKSIRMGVFTVATLPTPSGAFAGAIAAVSDANAPTYGAVLAGGGATYAIALCNGTQWLAH